MEKGGDVSFCQLLIASATGASCLVRHVPTWCVSAVTVSRPRATRSGPENPTARRKSPGGPTDPRRGARETFPTSQRIDVGIEHDQKFRVVQRLIGPRGKHMRDLVTMSDGAKLWITGRGSRSWEDDEGPLRRVSGSGEMNEIGYWFSKQLSVPLSRTWRMSTQVSGLGRTLSVVFWKGLCFFCDGIIGLWYHFCLDNRPASCAKFLVYRCGPHHLLHSLRPSSQPPTTFAAPKTVCVFRSTQAIFFGGTAVSRRRNSGELHHARRRRRVASLRD